MRQFQHSATTTAAVAIVWQIWADVEHWPEWDSELERASLTGPFVLGSSGMLKPKLGPTSRFRITELTAGVSFTFRVRLPLANLDVAHYFEPAGDATTFTHAVVFGGPLGWLFGRILGPQYAAALPDVLARIAQLAEAR